MNTNYKISFKANIKFVNEATFIRITDGYESVNLADIGLFKKACTNGAGPCIAGGMSNKNKGIIFHFPGFDENESLNLDSYFQKLKDEGKKITGFITGGEDDSRTTAFSINTFKKIKKFFDDQKIKTSIMCGQKNMACTDLMYIPGKASNTAQDTWVLNYYNYSDPKDRIKTVEDLKKAYKYIHISNTDTLWINGKKVERKDIPDILPEKYQE